jgi:hypothetical protein
MEQDVPVYANSNYFNYGAFLQDDWRVSDGSSSVSALMLGHLIVALVDLLIGTLPELLDPSLCEGHSRNS